MVNSKSQSSPQKTPPQKASNNSFSVSDSNNSWTVVDSAKIYNIEGWGEPYFAINEKGNVAVSTKSRPGDSVDLCDLIESLKQQEINLPLLIRFPDVLADRIARLHHCMQRAIARYSYWGRYQGVFPIKCNQNRHLIQDLVHYGRPYQFGLEAGSKPELMIALASLESEDCQSLLICNGYKDREYLETALLATKLGHNLIIVIEQLSELDLVLTISQKLDIKPVLGIRTKLATKGIGRWDNSTGDRSKFGLTVADILQVVHQLKAVAKLDCLQLLHFHIGSQISAIKVIKNAIREASQVYVQLVKLGACMQYLDVGGGLAVDYSGSKTNSLGSKNYNMQNYANDIVAQVKDACDQAQIAHPILISESGRAIAAHQSVLIFEVLNTTNIQPTDIEPPETNAPLVISNFWQTYQEINPTNLQESYHDAIQFKQEALSLFNFGYLSLVERGKIEQLYWACCYKISEIMDSCDNIPDELSNLSQITASTYHINLSIFRSIPDTWAINQLFPTMPIHRLNEKPRVKGVLADITCDSDGKIDQFIDRHGIKNTLELHPVDNKSHSPYYLGMFLIGAYQEIMGNLHNLFGKINVVQVKAVSTGYQVESVVQGDTIESVLGCVQYHSDNLLEIMHRKTQLARQNQAITPEEAEKLLKNYQNALNSYTYLN